MGKSVKEIIENEYGTEVDEYKNNFITLIIEAEDIIELTEDDKAFLERFTDMQRLIITQCKLKSLKNLPKLDKLDRLELNDNNISEGLEALKVYPTLKFVKFAGNKIKSMDELKALAEIKSIESIDFAENPVTKEAEYNTKVWEMFENLQRLDGFDKEGEECLSDLDEGEEFDYDGEGEGDIGDFIDIGELNEEELKQLQEQGFILADGEGEFDEDEEAEGEDEEAEGEDAEEVDNKDDKQNGKKRTREEEAPKDSKNKRQKTDE